MSNLIELIPYRNLGIEFVWQFIKIADYKFLIDSGW